MSNTDQGDDSNLSMATAIDQTRNTILNSILAALKAIFPTGTGTSATATGGAATLPANPVGFINVTLPNGSQAKVPYYNP